MKSKIFVQVAAALALAAGMGSASAGYIASGAVITSIANTAGNQKNFSITVTGGTGPCSETVIVFPEVDAADAKAHQRAYAAALLAFTTGARVSIYNYLDEGCMRASFIQVIK